MESLKVDEKPDPPAEDIVVWFLSRFSAVRMALSIEGGIITQ